jgi:hypothetical protein
MSISGDRQAVKVTRTGGFRDDVSAAYVSPQYRKIADLVLSLAFAPRGIARVGYHEQSPPIQRATEGSLLTEIQDIPQNQKDEIYAP